MEGISVLSTEPGLPKERYARFQERDFAMLTIGQVSWRAFFLILFLPSAASALNAKEIYQQVGPGIVLIMGSDDGKKGSGGTGSIVRSDGLVVTNAHVVISNETERPYKRIVVFLKPDRVTGNMDKDLTHRYKARLVGYDSDLDLAILKIEDPPGNLNVVTVGNPEEVSIGDEVIAIGHPETGGLWTLTTGAISAEIENFSGIQGKHIFQTETSLNRGNSGGPLLDGRGYMVGINTAISRRAADGLTITDINFSVKSSVARDWLRKEGVPLDYGPAASSSPPPPSSPPPATAPKAPEPQAEEKAPPESKPPAQPESKAPTPSAPEEKRPYNLDQLIADQMKEMEDLMEEMRGKIRSKPGKQPGK
jgi:serine protease Do